MSVTFLLLVAFILLILLAGIFILVAVILLINRYRTEKQRDEAWARMQTVVQDPAAPDGQTQDDWKPSTNAFGFLTIQNSDDRAMVGKHFDLLRPITTIGRSKDNDISLPMDSPVSRHHLKIEKREAGVYLAEILSRDVAGQAVRPKFGTFINNAKVELDTVLLRPGDLIRLGKRLQMRFDSNSSVPGRDEKTYLAFSGSNEDTDRTSDQSTQLTPARGPVTPTTKDTDV